MQRFGELVVRFKKTICIVALVLLIPSLIGFIKTRTNYDILVYLPENIEMKEIRLDEGNYDLMFEVQYLRKMDFKTGDPFGLKFWFIPSEFYYDAEEKQYSGEVKWNVETDEKQCLVGESGEYEIRITDYPYEEVWLMNYYSHVWNADKEVSVTIK